MLYSGGVMAGQDKWYFSREQLLNSPSKKCGLDSDKELAYRQQAANLIQDMGQKLHVSQLCINTAIVYMHRFYAFHSFTHFHRNAIAAAALFLAAKMEEQPRKLEYVIKISHLCLHRDCQHSLDVRSEYYQEQAQDLVFNENVLLQTLGFDVAIDHPHTHVVKTCSLIRASKDLAQTSYFMASNSLHLTTMCLQYKPTVVACFCIHLASKWSNWEIPQSNEGKHWFNYVDKSVTAELLEHLTSEFLHIFDRCPSRLKKKIMSMSNSQGSPSGTPHSSGNTIASSPFDKEPRKIPQEELDKVDLLSKHQQGLFGPSTASSSSTSSSVTKIDHREYRERQQRRAAAAAVAGSSSSNSTSSSAPQPGPLMQRPPPHRWPHPPRDPNAPRDNNVPRDAVNPKERDSSGIPHPNMRDTNMMRENPRDTVPNSREQTNIREQSNMRDPNIRESISSRDHNGIREASSQRESCRESSGIRDVNSLRDLTNQRDHNSQRDISSVNQREIVSSHNSNNNSSNSNSSSMHQTTDAMRLNNSNSDVRSVSASNVRDIAINNTSNLKETIGRDVNLGQSRSMSGHNRESSSRGHNGSSSNMPQQRSSHSRHLPPSQSIPPESRQRSSQQNTAPRLPQVLPASQPHPVLPQRPPSLFSPPEPQRKSVKPPSQPIHSPLLSIPREALVPAPLSPFSSPNEPEPKPVPEIAENIIKKEEAVLPSMPQAIIPPAVIEPELTNNLETDPNLVSTLLKESIPHRSEKKKKKEKHKHKDKKEKREKHKKKDKKRDVEQSSNQSNSNNGISSQSMISNTSNNISIKITLPREAAANVIPINSTISNNNNNNSSILSDGSPPPRLTIKIPKERIKIEPPTPPIQHNNMQSSQQLTQALKIKIPKEVVERENRKRPMMGQGSSRDGPASKSSRSQNASHQSSTKVSHHMMGNGQSNYHK